MARRDKAQTRAFGALAKKGTAQKEEAPLARNLELAEVCPNRQVRTRAGQGLLMKKLAEA